MSEVFFKVVNYRKPLKGKAKGNARSAVPYTGGGSLSAEGTTHPRNSRMSLYMSNVIDGAKLRKAIQTVFGR